MTSELTLLALRFGFLAVLWLFVFAIVFALRSDLFGQRARRLPADQQPGQMSAAPAAPPAPAAPRASAPAAPAASDGDSAARRLVITKGAKAGLEMPLIDGPLTIGRSQESNLVIRDDYTSTHHARLMLWNGRWVIQDLDSTNGTFLAGERVTVPTPVPVGSTVTIGQTSFELRR
ncbi:FHA domain-containing protein [Frigoribacterium sp. CFBP 13712]|uniref:FHA domain-containing protein FhaB/FipA n=1 Tax=Frigoribacterium sp. CFBP 13712 TaxID=2775309 RepID=UPI00177BB3EB|nr:FHA domain-containing protein [Frigoribacterium sp. CFBP 13712]MBD8704340.1 FHA domain-containing protein [Frigoribacterium sp. CFBP 13712]